MAANLLCVSFGIPFQQLSHNNSVIRFPPLPSLQTKYYFSSAEIIWCRPKINQYISLNVPGLSVIWNVGGVGIELA